MSHHGAIVLTEACIIIQRRKVAVFIAVKLQDMHTCPKCTTSVQSRSSVLFIMALFTLAYKMGYVLELLISGSSNRFIL